MPATHVLIRGHQFTYEEKAPFIQAGQSVLGAIEYDPANDQTKCHECGEWFSGMGNHIKQHGIKRVEYNLKYGLRERSPLSGLNVRTKHRVLATAAFQRGGNLARVDPDKKSQAIVATNKRSAGTSGNTTEYDNERGRCMAQSLFRIQMLAAQTGHTPTSAELAAIGLGSTQLVTRFGSVDAAMRLAELEPNRDGKPAMSVPIAFSRNEAEIKAKWESRMEWPKEYFDSGSVALERSGSIYEG